MCGFKTEKIYTNIFFSNMYVFIFLKMFFKCIYNIILKICTPSDKFLFKFQESSQIFKSFEKSTLAFPTLSTSCYFCTLKLYHCISHFMGANYIFPSFSSKLWLPWRHPSFKGPVKQRMLLCCYCMKENTCSWAAHWQLTVTDMQAFIR